MKKLSLVLFLLLFVGMVAYGVTGNWEDEGELPGTWMTTGKVGVGTDNPYRKLEVYHGIIGSSNLLRVGNAVDAAGEYVGIELCPGSGDYLTQIVGIRLSGDFNPTALAFYTHPNIPDDNQEVMRLDYNGNVGIGTTSPGQKLEVNGNLKILGNSYLTGNVGIGTASPDYKLDVDGDIRIPSNNRIYFGAEGVSIQGHNEQFLKFYPGDTPSPCVTMLGEGNVGIGTTNPSENLHVIGNVKISDRLRTGNNADGPSWNVGITGPVIQRSGNVVLGIESGNVGIGTTNPAAKLHVNGNSIISGNVGIGTTSPAGELHVSSGNSGDAKLYIEADTDNDNEYDNPMLIFRQDGGLDVSALQQDNNSLRVRNSVGNGGITFETGTAGGYTNAIERMRITDDGYVGIGTTNPQTALAVNGTITAKEIEVQTTGWPDFVFEDEYKLMSLNNLEQIIKKEKSLPGIPANAEAVEKGVKVGDMQARLLQKVEELTLYVIEQNKEITELKERISELEK